MVPRMIHHRRAGAPLSPALQITDPAALGGGLAEMIDLPVDARRVRILI